MVPEHTSITWEFVRNTKSQGPSWTQLNKNLTFTKFPGDSYALKLSNALKEREKRKKKKQQSIQQFEQPVRIQIQRSFTHLPAGYAVPDDWYSENFYVCHCFSACHCF